MAKECDYGEELRRSLSGWLLNAITGIFPKYRHTEEKTQKRRRQWDHECRDESGMTTREGMPAATRHWKRQRADSPLVSKRSTALLTP